MNLAVNLRKQAEQNRWPAISGRRWPSTTMLPRTPTSFGSTYPSCSSSRLMRCPSGDFLKSLVTATAELRQSFLVQFCAVLRPYALGRYSFVTNWTACTCQLAIPGLTVHCHLPTPTSSRPHALSCLGSLRGQSPIAAPGNTNERSSGTLAAERERERAREFIWGSARGLPDTFRK